jgi:hypothetical protein
VRRDRARLRRPCGAPFVFWAGLGASILIKGPIGILVAGLALVFLAVWERGAPWLKPIFRLGPILLGVAIFLPWMIAIGVATNGAFFIEAIAQDLAPKVAGGHEDHGGLPGYHLLLVPVNAWPGVLLLPAGAILAWTARREPAVRFLIAWAVPGWLLFDPALFLLGAAAIERGLGAGKAARAWAIGLLVFGSALLIALAPVIAATYGGPIVLAGAGAAILAGLALAILIAVGRKGPASALVLAAVAGIGFSILTKGLVLPGAKDLDVSRRVAAALAAHQLDPGAGAPRLVGAGYSEPSLIFLTRTDSALTTPERAAALAVPGGAAVIERGQRPAFDAALAARGLSGEEVAVVDGLNYSRGDPVSLTILRIQP